MSTSSQIVYFDNPSIITGLQATTIQQGSQISQIQNVSGLATQMDITKTLQGIQGYVLGGAANLPSTGAPAITVANSFMKATVGSSVGTDASGTNCFGFAGVIGNAFSGQEIYFSTGPCNSAGAQWNYTGTMMPLFSSAKFYNSFIFLKMLDERLINLSDTVGSHLPEWNTGNYYYYTGATGAFFTGAQLAALTADFSGWTGSRGTGALTELTIAHLISENLAFPHEVSMGPNQLQNWTTVPAASVGGSSAIPYIDWNFLNCIKDGYLAGLNGIAAGSPAAAIAAGNAIWGFEKARLSNNYTFMTGPVSDYLTTALNCIKNGTIPLGWKIGSSRLSPYTNTILQNGSYGIINYMLLAAICSKKAVSSGYTSLWNYFQQKILQPLEITSQDLFIYNYNAQPAGTTLAEPVCRRTQQQSTGTWTGIGADPQLWTDCTVNGRPFNLLYWQSQYPNERYANYPTTAFNDPAGWDFGQSITCNMKAWSRIIKCFINNGTYLQSNGQWVRVFSSKIINFSKNNCISPGAFWASYVGYPSNSSPNTSWVVAQCARYETINNFADIVNNISDYPGSSAQRTLPNAAISSSVFYWQGLFGTSFILDTETGYYILVANTVDGFLNVAKGSSAAALLPFICEA